MKLRKTPNIQRILFKQRLNNWILIIKIYFKNRILIFMQTSERINYIQKWIVDYCESMSKKPDSLVIGISGGIDSSVTSTICALTGKKTIVLSMPIKQIKKQHDLSIRHQNWLKEKFKSVSGHLIDLDLVFETFKHSLSKFIN